MPGFLKVLLLALIALVSGAIGFFASAGYLGARGSFDGLAYACKTLHASEAKGLLTKAQRNAVADEIMSADKKGGDQDKILSDYLRGDCKQSVWEAILAGANKK